MDEKITLKLTEKEAQDLVDCIDLAIKAGGLNVAKPGVHIIDKLMLAVQDAKETKVKT